MNARVRLETDCRYSTAIDFSLAIPRSSTAPLGSRSTFPSAPATAVPVIASSFCGTVFMRAVRRYMAPVSLVYPRMVVCPSTPPRVR